VVVALKVLFADAGSGLSLATVTVSVIAPDACGVTVNVMITGLVFVTVPIVPVIGLLFVERVPCVVTADFNVTEAGSVFVIRTFGALKGPLLATVIV